MKANSLKVWYVDFPSYRYNEDIKAIAKERGLKIVNARFKGSNKQCANAPKLTLVGEVTKEKDK